MGRFFLTVLLGVAIVGGVAWWYDLIPTSDDREVIGGQDPVPMDAELGKPLYFLRPLPIEPPAPPISGVDPIVIPAHLVVVDKLDVAPQIEGQLLFIGEEVPDEILCLAGVAPFSFDPYLYTPVTQGKDSLIIVYRRLKEGETVNAEQMVALLDPAKAINEVGGKAAKVRAADADYKVTVDTYREAVERHETAKSLYQRKLLAAEEYREKLLAMNKYREDIDAKKAQISVAEFEENNARIILEYHTIRNKIPFKRSVIKTIYHNRGEPVKNTDPVMHVYSTDRMRADGMVDVQYQSRLTEGMPVIVEPTVEQAPMHVLKGHLGEVHSVAVSKDGHILSASEDKTVRIRFRTGADRSLPHPEPVRVVACSPRECQRNWCAAGLANGHIYLRDLDQPDAKPVILKEAHTDAISSLAFSPDGAWFASGGVDNLICLWKTEGGELLYPFDAEHGVDRPPTGTITSLAFTPQGKLVSASRDNTLRVWALHEKGARLVEEPIPGRGGNVSQLGVSQDGRWMLFDRGRELHLLSVADGRSLCVLQNPSGMVPFETLALFSPDASLMLTAGAAEGRLQLWRTPSPAARGFEVRQFVTEEKTPVTCAAFSNVPMNGSLFAVSGTKDGIVYIWNIPSREQVDNHRIRNVRLDMISRTVDAGSRQLQVGVELRNPDGILVDGRPVTIVIEPPTK